MDAHKNLAVSTVATAPSPAASGTSLVVASGEGSRFPTVPFNATVWPSGQLPDPTNAEIVRVTAIATDTLTITRAQESTSARTILVGDLIAATITAKTLTDIENAIATRYLNLTPASATLPDGSTGNLAPGLIHIQGTETNPKKHLLALAFDGGGNAEYAWWTFVLPSDYVSGGTLDLYWMLNATSGAVKWQARVGAVTPDDADTPIEHAAAAAASVTTNANTTEANRLTKSTITLTMDSAAPGDLISFVIFRDSADAADTATQDAQLLGAVFSYTAA